MTGNILRKAGHRVSVLDLDPGFLARIRWLGQEAQAVLVSQDQALWAKTDPEMLPRLVGGAIVLQRMVRPSPDQGVVLQDDGAHLALATCCALCLSTKEPDPKLVAVLEETLELLAMCCPFKVVLQALPPLADLPPRYRNNPQVIRQYKSFPPAEDVQGPREVMLSDALVLFGMYCRAPSPPSVTLAQLEKITAGVRIALQRLKQAAG